MKFTKMHGIGNDYVLIDCFQEEVKDPSKVARFVCDRHFGIGADGIMLLESSLTADYKMEMYNADGSLGEMTGNGIRCLAKYVYDTGMTNKTNILVETGAGIKTLELEVKDGLTGQVRVNMGKPELAAVKIPVTYPHSQMLNAPLEVDGTIYYVTCVSMGNPHCVIFLNEDIRKLDIKTLGPKVENHSIFPKRTNVEFVNVLDRSHLRMRVWERGAEETLGCGTGACAASVAAVLNDLTDETIELELRGGRLDIVYDRTADEVWMSGPATFSFCGEITLPEDLEEWDDIKIY